MTRSSAGPISRVAKRELGWSPRIPLAQGLTQTIDYFDRLLAREYRVLAETA